jgi:hypothetical protein
MTDNQNDKKMKDRGKNLLDITNEYIENERPKNRLDSILKLAVEKLKLRTKVFTKKVKDNDRDFNTEFDIKKQGNLN